MIDDANKKLFSGELKGADVDWISRYNESEVIILKIPSAYRWIKLTNKEIIENKWVIGQHISIFITVNMYEKYSGLWNWICNEVDLKQKKDKQTYFELLSEKGYTSLDSIKEGITTVNDLRDIGITKFFHRKKIWNAIKKLQ